MFFVVVVSVGSVEKVQFKPQPIICLLWPGGDWRIPHNAALVTSGQEGPRLANNPVDPCLFRDN